MHRIQKLLNDGRAVLLMRNLRGDGYVACDIDALHGAVESITYDADNDADDCGRLCDGATLHEVVAKLTASPKEDV